jgi:hypothetical protein
MMLASPPDRLATKKHRNYVNTGAVDAKALATQVLPGWEAQWREVFNQLSKWGTSPSKIDEDDLQSPSVESLTRATETLDQILAGQFPPPNRLVGDGEGGLVAKWFSGTVISTIRFSEMGEIERAVFDGPRLLWRRTVWVDHAHVRAPARGTGPMANDAQGPPISDDELLYRRIPKSMNWYHAGDPVEVDDEAFRPHKQNDATGLSLHRARSKSHPDFMSIADAAMGSSRRGYVVAVLSVATLRSHGFQIEPRALEGNPGHVEIPQLNSGNRNSDEAASLMRLLAASVVRVEDPPLAS